MAISAQLLQTYTTFVTNLFATNPYTSTDTKRTDYLGTTGNARWNEIQYWVSLLANGLSTDLVTAKFNAAYAPSTNICPVGTDPLAESFYVDATQYPNGIFLSSVELYFSSKDTHIPVSIELRPLVNGYPSSSTIIPLSQVTMDANDVQIPTDPTAGLGPRTKFFFSDPVYLAPGEYCIVIKSNSNNYKVYCSEIGGVQFGTTNTTVPNTYIGSLFKSQNASTWTASQNEDLCFLLNRCEFSTGTVSFNMSSQTPNTEFDYDYTELMTKELNFGSLSKIDYQITSKQLSDNSAVGPQSITPNQNFQFATRQKLLSNNDISIAVTMTNKSNLISPVLDFDRVGSVLVQNLVSTTPVSVPDPTELLSSGGNALTKYITRTVTLANNFDATGLTVYVAVNRQPGTSIGVFYKVLNTYDFNSNGMDNRPYVAMTPLNTLNVPGFGLPTTSSDGWTEDTYQAMNISYTDSKGVKYTNFKSFVIKIVMYSTNPSIVPKISKFRVVATS